MAEERQLLITARLKNGSNEVTHGHGLPYPLPILNPVWVGMADIVAAKANGLVEVTIHNLEDPVILDDVLYNKLYNLGHINEDVVKEAEEERKAAGITAPAPSVTTPIVEEKDEEVPETKEKEEETSEAEETEEKKTSGKKNKKSKGE